MTVRSKKIAIVLPDLRGGGAERMRVNMAGEWLMLGFSVEFVLMRVRGELLSIIPHNARTVELGADRIKSTFWPIVRYLREHKPDVLLVAMWPLTVVAIAAAKMARFKGRVIVSDHVALSASPQAATWLRRIGLATSIGLTYRFANGRIAVSRGVADDLAALSGIPRTQIEVIYNPAAVGKPENSLREMPALPCCEKLILSVGTLKLQKDQATLIRAFALLPTERNAHLVILGEGDQRRHLENLIAGLGLQGRVHVPGFVTNTRPYYEAADLFVLSSKWEGFGNVIVEALECGVPVVSTNCPHGPEEILEGGLYGRLVAVGNTDALAQAIDDSLLAPHNEQALKRRASDFSVSRIATQYLSLMFPAPEMKNDET